MGEHAGADGGTLGQEGEHPREDGGHDGGKLGQMGGTPGRGGGTPAGGSTPLSARASPARQPPLRPSKAPLPIQHPPPSSPWQPTLTQSLPLAAGARVRRGMMGRRSPAFDPLFGSLVTALPHSAAVQWRRRRLGDILFSPSRFLSLGPPCYCWPGDFRHIQGGRQRETQPVTSWLEGGGEGQVLPPHPRWRLAIGPGATNATLKMAA
ncbi:unnamed protein product [Caretta caretta]